MAWYCHRKDTPERKIYGRCSAAKDIYSWFPYKKESEDDYEQRVDGMDSCLGRVSCRVGEIDEDLIRRLILRIKVINESKIEIHFKYGIIMEQEIDFYED